MTAALSRIRQVLWVGAGVALLSLLVVAGSWLFSPRPEAGSTESAPYPMPEQSVRRDSFRSEGTSAPVQRFTPEPGPRAAAATPAPPPASKTTVEPLDLKAPGPPPAAAAGAGSAHEVTPPSEPPRPVAQPAPPKAPPVTPPPIPRPGGTFGIQVGAFASAPNAEAAKKKLESMGYKVVLVRAGSATKVIAKGFPDRTSADQALADVRSGGYAGAFVLPLEQP